MVDEAITPARRSPLPLIAGAVLLIAIIGGLWAWLSAGK